MINVIAKTKHLKNLDLFSYEFNDNNL